MTRTLDAQTRAMTNQYLTQRFRAAAFAAVLVMAPSRAAQQVSEAELQFREAMHKQEVEGDLGGAIKLYQRIASTRNGNRAIVAKALLQLGDCYEKQGNTEARRAYERVVRDFSDQGEVARLARARLAEIAPTPDRRRDVTARRIHEWPQISFIRTVTRDGRYAAMSGPGGLELLNLESGSTRKVGAEKPSFPMAAISPDGSQIAYLSFSKGGGSELRVIGLSGDGPRTLYRHPSSLSIVDWSRDGSTILLGCLDTSGAERVTGAILFQVATGQAKEFATPKEFLGQYLPPRTLERSMNARLSPDARFIAATVPNKDDPGRTSVSVRSAAGPLREITGQLTDALVFGWTPDGGKLLFVSNQTGSYDLWSVAMNEGNPVGPPALVQRDFGEVFGSGISDDGRLFYSSIANPGSAYIGELDAEAARVRGLRPLEQPPGWKTRWLRWSPDGKAVDCPARVQFRQSLVHSGCGYRERTRDQDSRGVQPLLRYDVDA